MKSRFQPFKDMIDQIEKHVDRFLADTKTKPNVYSVAASYMRDAERKLTTAVIIAPTEEIAIFKLKTRIANDALGNRIEFISTIANKISNSMLDTIKKDC